MERDKLLMIDIIQISHFNSHAHVERDEAVYDSTDYFGISTHTLTWSVTKCANTAEFGFYFNSHAHVERDAKLSSDKQRRGDFNSHAHVERDWVAEGASSDTQISTHTLTWSVTSPDITIGICSVISTHTLTWSVTPRLSPFSASASFQLTRSRGA